MSVKLRLLLREPLLEALLLVLNEPRLELELALRVEADNVRN
jgi:hypothetical protein